MSALGGTVDNVVDIGPVAAVASRRQVAAIAVLGALAALGFGLALPTAPMTAIAVLVLVPLAFATPTAALIVLVAVTVLVPFELQDSVAVVGGRDIPGLLLVDAVALLGLSRVGWLLVAQRPGRRLALDPPLLIAVAIALVCAVALVLGVVQGAAVSDAGHEARRVVLGACAFVMAWPIVVDPVARRRLGPVLVVLGLALGLWGLAQWMFAVEFTSAADVGVRPGVEFTSTGRGQLQGGLFAYPVAVTLAWAALISGGVRSGRMRALLAAVVGLNACCLLLTYERTFWAVTALACVLVAAWSGAAARRLALRWAAVGVGLLAVLAVLAPGEIVAAAQRLVSVGQVRSDDSFSYRVIESQAVGEAIAERPLTGSGFGSLITWGSEHQYAILTTPFVHNGFLWLAWKVGIPAAAFVVLALAWAVARRMPAGDEWRWRSLRVGCRASVLGLLLVNITFPSVNVLGVTALWGLLAAVCMSPPDDPAPVPAAHGSLLQAGSGRS